MSCCSRHASGGEAKHRGGMERPCSSACWWDWSEGDVRSQTGDRDPERHFRQDNPQVAGLISGDPCRLGPSLNPGAQVLVQSIGYLFFISKNLLLKAAEEYRFSDEMANHVVQVRDQRGSGFGLLICCSDRVSRPPADGCTAK